MIFKLPCPQSKLVSLSFRQVMLLWNFVLLIWFSTSSPNLFCFFERLVALCSVIIFLSVCFFCVVVFLQHLHIPAKIRGTGCLRLMLSVYILGLQVGFKSLETWTLGYISFPINKTKQLKCILKFKSNCHFICKYFSQPRNHSFPLHIHIYAVACLYIDQNICSVYKEKATTFFCYNIEQLSLWVSLLISVYMKNYKYR